MTPETALAALRFVHFTSAMLVWGGGLYLTVLVPPGLAGRLTVLLTTPLAAVVALLLVASLLRLPVTAAGYGDGWADAFRPSILAAILRTSSGTFWLIDIVILAAMAGTQLLRRGRLPASTVLAGALLASSALTGHAAMAAGLLRLAHQLNDATHLQAAGFWLGALFPLTLILRAEPSIDALVAVRRFSVAAQVAVALAVATGIANALLVKGGMPADWSSAYDLALIAKVGIVAAMLCLALVNRIHFLPMLNTGSRAAARAIRRAALAEIALGLCVLGLVSVWDCGIRHSRLVRPSPSSFTRTLC